MVKYCPECGCKQESDCEFCPNCGYKVGKKQQSKQKSKVPNPVDFGKDNVITHPNVGDVTQTVTQIDHMKISSGLTEEQFYQLSNQLNQVLEQIGISKDLKKDGKLDLTEEQKELADAVENKVREEDKDFEKPVGNPETYLRLGNKALDEGLFEKAINHYEQAIQLNPKHAIAWYNKGLALYRLEKYEKALECYDQALKIDPDDANTWHNKGLALHDLEKYEEALECYDQALKIDPDDANTWHNKGLALYRLEKYEEALECYDQALKIDPDDAYTWYFKGLIPHDLEKYEEALECYDQALKIDPANAYTWNFKGLALYRLEKYEEALECYDQALKIDPANDIIRENRRIAQYYLGENDEANECLECEYSMEDCEENEDSPLGFSRSNPAPIGSTLEFEKEEHLSHVDYIVKITLKSIIRGSDAWEMIIDANEFNDEPRSGNEYILAKIKFEYIESSDDVTFDLSDLDFNAISEEGKVYETPSIITPEPKLEADLYPGSSNEGWGVFEVAIDDEHPLLSFGTDYQGKGGIWFKLYD